MRLWPPRGRRLCLFAGRRLRPCFSMTCKVGNGALLCFSTTRKVGNGALLVVFHDAQGGGGAYVLRGTLRRRNARLERPPRAVSRTRRRGRGVLHSRQPPVPAYPPPPSLHFPPRFGIIEVLSPRGQPCFARAHAAAGFPRLDFGGALWTRSRFTRSMLPRRSSP